MKLITKINQNNNIPEFLTSSDVVILGSEYALRPAYNFSLEEIKEINEIKNDTLVYVEVDKIIHEFDLEQILEFLKALDQIKVDGVVFQDLAVLNMVMENDLNLKLNFDPVTYLTSSNQVDFYANFNEIDFLSLSRELTYLEYKNIIKNVPNKTAMQVFGYSQMLHSKRNLIQNYQNFNLKVLGKELSLNQENSSLYDEERDAFYPLMVFNDQTFIFSPLAMNLYQDLAKLAKNGLNYAIVDLTKMPEENGLEILSLFRKGIDLLNQDAAEFKTSKNEINEKINSLTNEKETSLSLLYKKTIYKI